MLNLVHLMTVPDSAACSLETYQNEAGCLRRYECTGRRQGSQPFTAEVKGNPAGRRGEESRDSGQQGFIDKYGVPGIQSPEFRSSLKREKARMKRACIFLFVLMLMPVVVAAREDCSTLAERDKETCVVKNYQEADRELNLVYQSFVGSLEKPEPLRKGQRAWVQFRDAECSFVASWETLTKNGPYINQYRCLETITRYRTRTLGDLRIMYETRPQEYEPQ
ncbi:MAG TPA: lysozyme inhibitor LprI family protein [Candidatus Methylomirabilis sp.]|nr:lysozyme inhibitor LprI family protein [Candidatus Methylomirabilis sp.]